MLDIVKIKSDIAERLKKIDPEKVILFGSYAYGTPTEDSDIDLYVVTKDDFLPQSYKIKREIVRHVSRQIADIRESVSIDLLVHTKAMSEDFFTMKSSFSQELLEKGESLL